jgi:hypothetical protein
MTKHFKQTRKNSLILVLYDGEARQRLGMFVMQGARWIAEKADIPAKAIPVVPKTKKAAHKDGRGRKVGLRKCVLCDRFCKDPRGLGVHMRLTHGVLGRNERREKKSLLKTA